MALMTTHIWRILKCPQSLWVQWIHTYRLKGKNFWDILCVAGASVGWRKILAIRHVVRDRFIYELSNGLETSAWFDIWSDIGPLADVLSSHVIHAAGFILNLKVRNIVVEDYGDVIKWKDVHGDLKSFSVSSVWNAIRTRAPVVSWYNMVCDMLQACDSWKDVVLKLHSVASRKSVEIIVTKLIFGASVYVIWQERNARLFQKKSRTYDKVFEAIYSTIRWKIMSIKWKNSLHVRNMKAIWKIH
ncbi:uncharacterized protein [Rutidosis leptorrhynchoides]|uniref:uncharacterized protein n=1 Tax=Rutidosis leptorrhynchoides TaxID=125765 RepID=UPI003A99EE2A